MSSPRDIRKGKPPWAVREGSKDFDALRKGRVAGDLWSGDVLVYDG